MPGLIYGTIEGADAYAATVAGATAWAALTDDVKTEFLMQASLYVDALSVLPAEGRPGCRYRFPGQKAGGYQQVLQWPRRRALVEGEKIPDDEVPAAIVQATYIVAVRLSATSADPTINGSLPSTTGSNVVKREKVGPLEREFAVSAAQPGVLDALAGVAIMPDVLALIRGLLVIVCGAGGVTAIMAV